MRRTRLWIGAVLVIGVLAIVFIAGRSGDDEPQVGIKWSETAPWIEVYRAGELASEWQPSDGLPYELLKALLEEETLLYPDLRLQSPFMIGV